MSSNQGVGAPKSSHGIISLEISIPRMVLAYRRTFEGRVSMSQCHSKGQQHLRQASIQFCDRCLEILWPTFSPSYTATTINNVAKEAIAARRPPEITVLLKL
jgi:hypothetical protein